MRDVPAGQTPLDRRRTRLNSERSRLVSCPVSKGQVVLQSERRTEPLDRHELRRRLRRGRRLIRPNDIRIAIGKRIVGAQTIREALEPRHRPGDRRAQLNLRRRVGRRREPSIERAIGGATTDVLADERDGRPVALDVVRDPRVAEELRRDGERCLRLVLARPSRVRGRRVEPVAETPFEEGPFERRVGAVIVDRRNVLVLKRIGRAGRELTRVNRRGDLGGAQGAE